jgi:hypothetical protein
MNRLGRHVTCAVLLLGLTLTTASHATRHVQWSVRSSSYLSVSGVSSGGTATEVRLLRTGLGDHTTGGYPLAAFRAITIGESSDKPCFAKFEAGKLDESSSLDGVVNTEWCGTITAGDYKEVKAPSGAFFRGIQVCTNDSDNNPRLKGLRAWSVRFDDAGKPTNVAEVSEFDRANCKKWHDEKKCATGEVVTAFKFYKKDNSISGISIECRPAYSATTSPRDYAMSIPSTSMPEPDANGISQADVTVRLKNLTAKAFRHSGLRLQTDAAKHAVSCMMRKDGTFEVPANGSVDVEMHVGCKWEDLFKAIPGCDPGKQCKVDFTYVVEWHNEPYSSFSRPREGGVDVRIKRPGSLLPTPGGAGAVPRK